MTKEILEITKNFHDTYEKLASEYAYKTREDTKVFDINSNNGKLMYATVNEIVSPILKENQELKESIEHLKKENKKQKNILDEIYNHCESRINVCKSLQSDDEWECCIAELDGVISILKEVE